MPQIKEAELKEGKVRIYFNNHARAKSVRNAFLLTQSSRPIKQAVDIYFHINPEDVKQSYFACVPELGV